MPLMIASMLAVAVGGIPSCSVAMSPIKRNDPIEASLGVIIENNCIEASIADIVV